MSKIPVIIDVDTGIDDAMALVLALQSDKLDIRGITTVAGNQTIEKTTRNTLVVVEYFGRSEIPVAMGAKQPLVRPQIIAAYAHGESGLGTAVLPKAEKQAEELDAIDFIRTELEKSDEKITLVPTGPLTNIAILLKAYPHIKEKIEKIVLMGGGAFQGNSNATAEFNIYADPEAASIVFNSGIKLVMCGLDVTMKAIVTPDDINTIKAIGTKASDFIAEAFEFYMAMYKKNANFTGCAVHDAVTITYLIAPELIKTRQGIARVDIDGKDSYAATICDFRPWRDTEKDNALVGVDIDREAFVQMLLDACKNY
ncbi:MAG: nucleoside hydrolase [Oscillospiraceae bacterium]|nr:nucleoside hydrolase [Oscillospiraceae bacterium]